MIKAWVSRGTYLVEITRVWREVFYCLGKALQYSVILIFSVVIPVCFFILGCSRVLFVWSGYWSNLFLVS